MFTRTVCRVPREDEWGRPALHLPGARESHAWPAGPLARRTQDPRAAPAGLGLSCPRAPHGRCAPSRIRQGQASPGARRELPRGEADVWREHAIASSRGWGVRDLLGPRQMGEWGARTAPERQARIKYARTALLGLIKAAGASPSHQPS